MIMTMVTKEYCLSVHPDIAVSHSASLGSGVLYMQIPGPYLKPTLLKFLQMDCSSINIYFNSGFLGDPSAYENLRTTVPSL